jgi:predicted Zn-dependent protease
MKRTNGRYSHTIHTVILITVFLSSFIYLQWKPDPAFCMSIEAEEKLGSQYLAELKQQIALVDDDFAQEYINNLGTYLISHLESKPFPFNFYIINNNQSNAFSAPGGHIFIYTGLIEMMDLNELAGIICHEIAHVTLRHISDQVEKGGIVGLATMAGVLAGAMLGGGGDASDAIIMGSLAAGQQVMLSYSRDDERQADQTGFTYASNSGFDPSAMIGALTKLQQGQYNINEIPAYLLTHPVGSERMSSIESMLASYHSESLEKDSTEPFREDYPLFRTIIKAKYSETRNAESAFNAELQKDPDSSLAHLGIAIIMKDREEYSGAIDHFQKALKGMPDPLLVLRYMSETYQLMGQNRESIKVLEDAMTSKNKNDKSSLFLLATAYQNLEEFSKAAEIYERLTFMEPVKDQLFYNLGMTYGSQDKLALAHYNFGIYNKRINRIQESRFHFQKARELAGDDPVLQEKIKKATEGMDEKKPGGGSPPDGRGRGGPARP